MADTFTQLHIHTVFAVKGRNNLISKHWKNELFKFVTGIVTNDGNKLIAINGMPDHVHMLIGLRPDMPLSDVIRDVKANSSRFINRERFIRSRFEWQAGYGAFSISHSQISRVAGYIEDQELHHKETTFREEYLSLLNEYEIKYKPEFLFEDVSPFEVGDFV